MGIRRRSSLALTLDANLHENANLYMTSHPREGPTADHILPAAAQSKPRIGATPRIAVTRFERDDSCMSLSGTQSVHCQRGLCRVDRTISLANRHITHYIGSGDPSILMFLQLCAVMTHAPLPSWRVTEKYHRKAMSATAVSNPVCD